MGHRLCLRLFHGAVRAAARVLSTSEPGPREHVILEALTQRRASSVPLQELEKLGLGDSVDLHVYEIPVEYKTVQRLIPALWEKHSPQVGGRGFLGRAPHMRAPSRHVTNASAAAPKEMCFSGPPRGRSALVWDLTEPGSGPLDVSGTEGLGAVTSDFQEFRGSCSRVARW